MNKKLSGMLGIIFSLILLVYFEGFIYKVIGLIGINISNYRLNPYENQAFLPYFIYFTVDLQLM